VPEPDRPGPPLRVAHLTTVDMSLALLLGTELRVDLEEGFEVYGISAPGPYVAAVEALGVTHVALPTFSRAWGLAGDVRAAVDLARALRRIRPDVLHTHTPKAGVLGRLLGRVLGVPAVVNTVHGLWVRPDQGRFRRGAVLAVEMAAARFSHMELYQNAEDQAALARAVPARRSRLVGNGVDLGLFRADPEGRARVRAELGVGDDELLVGGVGRRVAEKGIVELAAAARALEGRARFVWAGPEDPSKPDHLKEAEAGVAFLPARDDMPAFYSALDVFALPSYREGFSRSAMEAAACGLAMVLSDIRGCREIGAHDRHLLLVPPRDPAALTATLALLLDDPDRRDRLGRAAAERARASFDQRAVAAQSIKAYREVLASR
jgi:glycosyltransferase involved in cell wall biosynthesis